MGNALLYLQRTHIEHPLIALAIQFGLWACGYELWEGGAVAVFGFYMREIAQSRFNWSVAYEYGYWWDIAKHLLALDLSRDGMRDFWPVPTVCLLPIIGEILWTL